MKHNRADIKRDVLDNHPSSEHSNSSLRIAGKVIAPFGFEYQASAAVHLFKKPGSMDFVFINQIVGFDRIEEGHADVAHKELRKSLMGLYGREDGRRKDTKDEMI